MKKFTVKAVDGVFDIIDPCGFAFECVAEEKDAEERAEAYTLVYALGWNDSIERSDGSFLIDPDDMMSDYAVTSASEVYATATNYK